jgi:phospholipase/carboxylesterase
MTLPAIEHETAARPRYSIIWLHGLGADGNDFAPIVPELVDPAWPPLRFVFPHAPVRPVTINNGMSMRACTTSPRSISTRGRTRPVCARR